MLVLIVPTRTEAERLMAGDRTFRGLSILPGALPPNRVFEAACQADDSGWLMPRLIAIDGAVVGSIGFKGAACDGAVEIGYNVADACRCRGYATQAVALLKDGGFDRAEVSAITAETLPSNTASRRVLEKNGFERVGRIERDGVGHDAWRLLRGPA